MPDAAEHDRLERLQGLARVWGALYLYHPALVVPDRCWEEALVAAIPAIEAAAAPSDYAAALNEHLLRHLDDPHTFAALPKAGPTALARPAVAAVRRPGGAIWLDSGALGGETQTDRLRALARKIGEADERGLVLDWRWANAPDEVEWLIWRAVVALLIEQPLPMPATHERIHYGWSEVAGSLYHSTWFMHGTNTLQPLRSEEWPGFGSFPGLPLAELKPYAGPVAIILNDLSFAFGERLLAALQSAGRARLVLETQGRAIRSETPERLWGGVEAHLRLHRLAMPDGWIAATPEQTLPLNDDRAAAVAAAETLLGKRAATANSVRPFVFPVAMPRRAPGPERALSREERLAGLFKLWIVVGEFFPHLEFASGDWRRLILEWTLRFERAADPADHVLALNELAATFNDSHVWVTDHEGYFVLPALYGRYRPPIALRDVEGKIVIAEVHHEGASTAGAKVGMVVSAIDGRPIDSLLAERGVLVSASTPQSRRNRTPLLALVGAKDTVASLIVEEAGGPRTVTLLRDRMAGAFAFFERTEAPIRQIEEFGYVDLDRVDSEPEIVRAFKEFAAAPGIIFDMRGYPKLFVQLVVVSRLIKVPTRGTVFAYQERSGTLRGRGAPREERWRHINHVVEPDPDMHYGGPIVVLIDETAISASEDFCTYLRNARRATFVGSPTAGTNGNVTEVRLIGGFSISFTGARAIYADGTRFQNIGILPDVEARPTLAGVRAGRDEVLEAGVETLRRLVRAKRSAPEPKEAP